MRYLLTVILLCHVAFSGAEDKPAPTTSATPAPADKTEKDPPALTHYMGREIAQTMHFTGAEWLTRENRERQEECSKLMKVLGLKEGQRVCDMGCGNGFYTLKLARVVGKTGRVVAVDVQPEMLDLLKKRAGQADLENVECIVGGYWDPKLPENSLDMVFMVDVYHEFDHPIEMLEHIRKSLKPGGRVALVEFRAEDPKVPIKPLHKMSKAQILKEFPPNGFKLVEQFDELPWQHLMFFERDDTAVSPERLAK